MRIVPTLITSALLLALVANAAHAQEKKKLYRWTDDKGEVHYTDQLPPEAAKSQRDELNKEGRAVDRVERAKTPEERAVFEAEQARLAEEQRLVDETAKMDSVLTMSYPSEADLERAYEERFDLLKRNVETAEIGIRSQDQALTDLLTHAADLERNGKPVPDSVVVSIGKTRQQLADQRVFLTNRETERIELQKEYDAILARYRELATTNNAKDAPSIPH